MKPLPTDPLELNNRLILAVCDDLLGGGFGRANALMGVARSAGRAGGASPLNRQEAFQPKALIPNASDDQ